MDSAQSPTGYVTLTLSQSEAVVLFELLHRMEADEASLENVVFADQAEQRVVWDMSACLERLLVEPFASDWVDKLAAARSIVRDPVE